MDEWIQQNENEWQQFFYDYILFLHSFSQLDNEMCSWCVQKKSKMKKRGKIIIEE